MQIDGRWADLVQQQLLAALPVFPVLLAAWLAGWVFAALDSVSWRGPVEVAAIVAPATATAIAPLAVAISPTEG